MQRSCGSRRRRGNKLKARVNSDAHDHFLKCTIIGCGRPTARASKQGLSAFTCRYHQQHRQRHGSHWCKSPSAAVLRPYLSAALSFIEAHRADIFIGAALTGVGGIMASAGPVEIANRLKGLPPDRRARIALARLYEAGKKPERVLAIPLAIAALIEDAPAL